MGWVYSIYTKYTYNKCYVKYTKCSKQCTPWRNRFFLVLFFLCFVYLHGMLGSYNQCFVSQNNSTKLCSLDGEI